MRCDGFDAQLRHEVERTSEGGRAYVVGRTGLELEG